VPRIFAVIGLDFASLGVKGLRPGWVLGQWAQAIHVLTYGCSFQEFLHDYGSFHVDTLYYHTSIPFFLCHFCRLEMKSWAGTVSWDHFVALSFYFPSFSFPQRFPSPGGAIRIFLSPFHCLPFPLLWSWARTVLPPHSHT